jgi:stage II sporulation protein D
LRIAVVLSLLGILAGSAGSSPAGMPETKATPPTFVITGRGWGHGVGMSQYGALGYARHGWSYAKILDHFYPGTTRTQTNVAQVRVLLTEGRTSLSIYSQAPFRVRDGDGTSYKLAAGQYRIGPSLKVKVDGESAPKALPGPITFTPGRVPLVFDRPYRGSLRVSSKSGRLQAVNIIGLEDYTKAVVPEEVSQAWPVEALKAQAVATRAYVVATRKPDAAFDVYPDTRSQVYGGVNAEKFSTSAAVEATAGVVLSYHGKPAITYFFASSGGRTASIQDAWPGSHPVPYLVSVPDPYDVLSPFHHWGPYVFSAQALAQRLRVSGTLLDAIARRNHSQRVSKVALTLASRQLTLSGPDVRNVLGLRSSWFAIGALSIDKPTAPLSYGVRTTLTGLARGVKKVRLEQRSQGKWQQVVPVEAAGDGTFAAALTPAATRLYRLSNGNVAGTPVQIQVAPVVRLDPASSQSFLTGHVRPALSGKEVAIQRLRSTGWSNVARATVDDQGQFTATLTLHPGTYRARFAPGEGLVPGVSPILRIVTT